MRLACIQRDYYLQWCGSVRYDDLRRYSSVRATTYGGGSPCVGKMVKLTPKGLSGAKARTFSIHNFKFSGVPALCAAISPSPPAF
jgi:hypothetical protein